MPLAMVVVTVVVTEEEEEVIVAAETEGGAETAVVAVVVGVNNWIPRRIVITISGTAVPVGQVSPYNLVAASVSTAVVLAWRRMVWW